MPTFKLPVSENNLKIAELLKADGCRVERRGNAILVEFNFGLNIFRVEAGSLARGLTDEEWRRLTEDIRSTLEGAKVSEATDMVISIRPLKTEMIRIRINPQEKEVIRRAAAVQGLSFSEFVRRVALKEAEEAISKASEQSEQKRPYVA